MTIKLLAVLISALIFIFVIDLIRREKLTFKYAVLWLCISAMGVLCAAYEKLLFRAARLIGFQLPSNFIFFLVGAIFVIVSLVLTVYICQQNNRSEIMAQKLGILELELSRIKKERSDKTDRAG